MNTILDLVDYVNTNEPNLLSRNVESVCSDYEDVTARIVFIKILGWLRRQSGPSIREMKLSSSYPWAICLRECVSNCSELAEWFSIDDDVFTFNSVRKSDEISDCISYVVDNFKPMLLKD